MSGLGVVRGWAPAQILSIRSPPMVALLREAVRQVLDHLQAQEGPTRTKRAGVVGRDQHSRTTFPVSTPFVEDAARNLEE